MIKSFETQLTILQQEGYSPARFLSWWLKHPFKYTISSKKPLIKTPKVHLLIRLSKSIFFLSFILSLVFHLYYLSPVLLALFIFFPFVFIFLAQLTLVPYEKNNRTKTIKRIRSLLLSRKDTTTIGITGSFGKTSVKDFLYTIITGWQETVKTPESYNTVFGIAKVVDLELLSKTKIFICEMGAYVRGEIAELCHMVPPQYAILTAVGTQHLERFKSLTNTTLAKFELVDSVIPSKALVNLDNSYIANHLKQAKYKGVLTYSLLEPKADFYISKYHLTSKGVSFVLKHQNKSTQFESALFGTSNLYNLTAAISMGLILKVPLAVIKKQMGEIRPSPHRLELKKINQATLIDNAFSSNEEGFTAILGDLKNVKGKKVIITPGIVELGQKNEEVHFKLGQFASNIFDQFILVGKTERTQSFAKGLGIKRNKVTYIDNATNLWPLIEDLSKKYDWILLENDLPDNF